MDGGIDDLYLNFNVLNNEVFEIRNDDKLLEVAERAVVRNKGFAAEGKQPCVGTIWAPDDGNGRKRGVFRVGKEIRC